MALQVRRGTDAERQGVAFIEGELVFATDTGKLYVGARDGNNDLVLGGKIVSGTVQDDDSPQLGGDLDLNGNNIVGTGNINITGTITASGNINLGDGVEDNVIVGGQIASSLTPKMSNTYDLGDTSATWRKVHAQEVVAGTVRVDGEMHSNGANIDGELLASNIVTDGNITKTDSTVIYNGTTGDLTLDGIVEAAGLKGSVFGDDSTTLIDGITGNISNGTLSLEGLTIVNNGLGLNFYDDTVETNTPGVVFGTVSNRQAILVETEDKAFIGRGIAAPDVGVSLQLQAARFTGGTPVTVQENDSLGQVEFSGYNGSEYKKAGILRSTVDSALGGGNFTSNVQVSVLNADGLYRQFAFQGDGVFDAGLAVKLYNASDAELAGFGTIAEEGSLGYGADRDAPVLFNGTNFITVATNVTVPTGPTATGKAGQVAADADYMYMCHATDQWIRVAKDGTWT